MSFFLTKPAKIAMAVITAAAIAICVVLILFAARRTPAESSAVVSSEETSVYAPDGSKVAYLTFDNGPSNCTPAVLSALQSADVKASFFVSFQSSATLQEYYQDIVSQGHLLGVKGYIGDDTVYSSASDLLADLDQMFTFLEMSGIRLETRQVRLPGGSNNAAVDGDLMQQVLLNLNRDNYLYYDWNVWADGEGSAASKDEIVHGIMTAALSMDEPVILLHDINDNDAMVEALPEIITQLKEAGYAFDTVDHMAVPLHHVEYVEEESSSEPVNSYDPIETSSYYPTYTVTESSLPSYEPEPPAEIPAEPPVEEPSEESSGTEVSSAEEPDDNTSDTGGENSEDTSDEPVEW